MLSVDILLGLSVGGLNLILLLFHQDPGAETCPSRGWCVIADKNRQGQIKDKLSSCSLIHL